MQTTERKEKAPEDSLPMPILEFYAKYKTQIETGVFGQFHVSNGLVFAYTNNELQIISKPILIH